MGADVYICEGYTTGEDVEKEVSGACASSMLFIDDGSHWIISPFVARSDGAVLAARKSDRPLWYVLCWEG